MIYLAFITYYFGLFAMIYVAFIDYRQMLSEWILLNNKEKMSNRRLHFKVVGSTFYRISALLLINFILGKICSRFGAVTVKSSFLLIFSSLVLIHKTFTSFYNYRKCNVIGKNISIPSARSFSKLNASSDMLHPLDKRWSEIEPIKLVMTRPTDTNSIESHRIPNTIANRVLSTLHSDNPMAVFTAKTLKSKLIQSYELTYPSPISKNSVKVLIYFRSAHDVYIPTISTITSEQELKGVINILNYIHIKQTKHSIDNIYVITPKNRLYKVTKGGKR